MKITIKEGQPYATAQLTYWERKILFENGTMDCGWRSWIAADDHGLRLGTMDCR